MQEHAGGKGAHFDYLCPQREVLSALKKLTGQSQGGYDLRFVSLEGSPQQQRLKRQLFLKLAQRWSAWWTAHWRDCVATEEEAQQDEKTGAYDEKATMAFLFQAREGTCGAMQLKPPLRQKYVEGSLCMADGGLEYRFLYQKPAEE